MRGLTHMWLALLVAAGCGRDREPDPYDLDFDIPRTHEFSASLTAYELFNEPLASLQPADGVYLYELSSELFTDYAYKQRLVRVPDGSSVELGPDGRLEYPEGSLMAKTFYYPDDMRAADGPRRIIETRLLVRTNGIWNVATYLWNEEQTDATLLVDGTTAEVSWIDEDGESRSTDYVVPHEGECVTCHQLDGASAYIGPTLFSLNRDVSRDDADINQLAYLQSQSVLGEVDTTSAPAILDYRDQDLALEDRARAYLDINCAHCHNPGGWDEATDRDFDFRHTTPLGQTGLTRGADRVQDALERGDMPFLGTTLPHDDGIQLVLDYLDRL